MFPLGISEIEGMGQTVEAILYVNFEMIPYLMIIVSLQSSRPLKNIYPHIHATIDAILVHSFRLYKIITMKFLGSFYQL